VAFPTTHKWVSVWPSSRPLPTIFIIELSAKMLRDSFPWCAIHRRRAQATLRRAPPPAAVAKPPPPTMGQAAGAYVFVQSHGASPALSPVSLVIAAPLNLAAALPSRHRSWPGRRGQAPAMLSPSMDACEPPDAPPHLLRR
jgi:hypothetical protein